MSQNTVAQTIKKIILDEQDTHSGYYLVVEPQNKNAASGVLLLLAGFGQIPDATPPETKLHNVAYAHNIITVFYAGGNKLYADSITQTKLSKVINDIIKRYKVNRNNFVLGGYSAGGMLAMRYVELCYEFPDKFPIQPKGVFTVDSPIDIFTIYEQLEESAKNNYSELAVEEAVRAMGYIKNDYGIPRENVSTYAKLTAFSMNKSYSQNEIHLKNCAVRTYHDVDIAWRIKNRNQTVHLSNYEVTAELINRLVLMGNKQAEFMQSFQTGYRSNGQRHPHSWSIVNEVELMQWMKELVQ
ncbi:MAG: alpha/beta hydrolase [Phycisphaerales bacterium]|nr:alpha/beta hydrolase [Phycisphaerales bacterium]